MSIKVGKGCIINQLIICIAKFEMKHSVNHQTISILMSTIEILFFCKFDKSF